MWVSAPRSLACVRLLRVGRSQRPSKVPIGPPLRPQVVICKGDILKTCCAISIPKTTTTSTTAASAGAAAGATAGAASVPVATTAVPAATTSYSAPASTAGTAGSSGAAASGYAGMQASSCAPGDNTSLCAQAAALLAAQQAPKVPALVCKVGWAAGQFGLVSGTRGAPPAPAYLPLQSAA